MSEEDYQQLERLSVAFEKSKNICDPFDFLVRKRDLIEMIAITLLAPFYIERAKRFDEDE